MAMMKCGGKLNLILTLLLVLHYFHPVLATNSQTEKALLSTLAVLSAGALYAFERLTPWSASLIAALVIYAALPPRSGSMTATTTPTMTPSNGMVIG